MPVFDYKCKKCGKSFEKLVSSSDQKVKCVSCGKDNVEKQVSSFFANASTGDFCPSEASCPSAGSSSSCAHGGGCGCPMSH